MTDRTKALVDGPPETIDGFEVGTTVAPNTTIVGDADLYDVPPEVEAIAAWNQRTTTDDVALKPCRECDCTGVAETIGGYDRPCDACSGMGEIRTRAALGEKQ